MLTSTLNIDDLRGQELIVFECISGSKAYGLDGPESDTDLKGIFLQPKEQFYGMSQVQQLNDDGNNVTFYELGRFMELLSKSNPNILEMLYTPEESVVLIHPLIAELRKLNFLSRQCRDTFGGYASTQVKKARGLNKKILNPVAGSKKSVTDFCHVVVGNHSVHLLHFLKDNGLEQKACGLSKIPNMPNLYSVHYGESNFNGIVSKEKSNDVCLSSIPKDSIPIGTMYFNKTAYSQYCKEYKAYWEWTGKRNESRFKSTMHHGKNYDAKNMMHTFRLLNMCEEIGREGKLHVRRPDRKFLLDIKSGLFDYEELINLSEAKIEEIDKLYKNSTLPDFPNIELINQKLIDMRTSLYDV